MKLVLSMSKVAVMAALITVISTLVYLTSRSVSSKTLVKWTNERPINGSYFAMCTIAKNEDGLEEWIEYHRRLGCGKFYLFDDNSTVPLLGSIQKYVTSGLVDYQFGDYSYYYLPQTKAYDLCLQLYGKRHRFMGFLDTDEFIVVTNKSKSIPDVLQDYTDYGGVAVQWRMFGSSGHVNKPEGGILKNYYKCCSNPHIKTIVNTLFQAHCSPTIHEFQYRDKVHYTVLTNRTRIKGPFNRGDPQYDVMYLNHYNIKSWEDFQKKVEKGKANRNKPISDPRSYFDGLDRAATDDCEYLTMPSEKL